MLSTLLCSLLSNGAALFVLCMVGVLFTSCVFFFVVVLNIFFVIFLFGLFVCLFFSLFLFFFFVACCFFFVFGCFVSSCYLFFF